MDVFLLAAVHKVGLAVENIGIIGGKDSLPVKPDNTRSFEQKKVNFIHSLSTISLTSAQLP